MQRCLPAQACALNSAWCLTQVPYVAAERKGKVEDEEYLEAEASCLTAGSRCEVEGGRRGVVQFVGKCDGLPLGYWVGVQVRQGTRSGAEHIGKHWGEVCAAGYDSSDSACMREVIFAWGLWGRVYGLMADGAECGSE